MTKRIGPVDPISPVLNSRQSTTQGNQGHVQNNEEFLHAMERAMDVMGIMARINNMRSEPGYPFLYPQTIETTESEKDFLYAFISNNGLDKPVVTLAKTYAAAGAKNPEELASDFYRLAQSATRYA